MKSQKGFTLIELLVVIAIIGILSGIVLTSLNTARGKSKDAAIKAQLTSLRSQMELDADGNAYSCTFGTQAQAIASKIATDSGGTVTCNLGTGTFAVSAPISSGSWCVDNAGSAKAGSANAGTCQ